MAISFNQQTNSFNPWTPNIGQVYDHDFSFVCATDPINEESPWIVPPLVVVAVFNGQRGYYIQREHVDAFYSAHRHVAAVFHGAAFALATLKQVVRSLDIYSQVEQTKVWDTELLHQLLVLGTDGYVPRDQSSLECCVHTYLSTRLSKEVLDSNGRPVRLSYGQWLNRPLQDIEPAYLTTLAEEAIATLQVYQALRARMEHVLINSGNTWGYVSPPFLKEQVQRWGPQTHHIQLMASIVLREVTRNGLHVDHGQLNELKVYFKAKLVQLDEELRKHGYMPTGPSARKSLQAAIKRVQLDNPDLNLPRTDSGEFATSREALQDSALSVPFIQLHLEYEETKHLLDTFVSKAQKGVLHPSFKVLVRSGRTSSYGEINAQNLPKDIRVRSAIVPSAGMVFLDCDYKTIELVTLAQACMRQFILSSGMAVAINQGIDLHRLFAARVKGIPESEVTDEDRNQAKAINFGKPGGMGLKTLQQYAKLAFNVELSYEEVRGLSGAWEQLFPEMKDFLKNDLGLRVAARFGLTPASYLQRTGQEWREPGQDANQPSSMMGWTFLKAISTSSPTTSGGRPYSEHELAYFWSRLESQRTLLSLEAQHSLDAKQPSSELKKAVITLVEQPGVITLTGRLRANCSYTQRRNTIFQGLAADGAKLSLWRLWRSGYRIVNFVHDQVLIEVNETEDQETHSRIVQGIMVNAMREVVPDVRVTVNAVPNLRRWQ